LLRLSGRNGSLDSRIFSTRDLRIDLDIFFREALLDDFWRLSGWICWRSLCSGEGVHTHSAWTVGVRFVPVHKRTKKVGYFAK